jgi:GNAT superfamily N-acetyltransferase
LRNSWRVTSEATGRKEFVVRTAIYPTSLHFRRLASHFLSLTSGDRLLRFGSVLTDIDIVAYVERLFVSAASVFIVVEPDQDISGVVALELTERGVRLGLSVSSRARNLGVGTVLLQRAGLLACTRGLKTVFVPNLRFNAALQQLALSLGMNLVCASGAVTAIAVPPTTNRHEAQDKGFAGSITLADDSLRCTWESERRQPCPLSDAKTKIDV